MRTFLYAGYQSLTGITRESGNRFELEQVRHHSARILRQSGQGHYIVIKDVNYI